VHCTAYNCGNGFYVYAGAAAGCVAYECTTGFTLVYGAAYNCVADSNTNGFAGTNGNEQAVGCRITNNTAYGISGTKSLYDPYCFYGGNGANFQNDIHDDTVDGTSTRVTSGTVGYIDGDNATLADRNYGLTNSATSRRQEVTL